MTEATTGKELTVQERASRALGLANLEADLKKLAESSKSITAITNQDGYQQCHAKRMVLRNQRVDIEKRGKVARDDANAFAKAVIAEQRRLIEIISPEEERLQNLQQDHDDALEAERQQKIEAEERRVEAIHVRIAEIRAAVEPIAWDTPAKDIAVVIARVGKIGIDHDTFAEFVDQANDAKDATLARLLDLNRAAADREAEQRRIAAEREELEKFRAEQAKREKAEREAREAREAEARKKIEAAAEKRREEMAEQQRQVLASARRLDEERQRLARRQEIRNQIVVLRNLPTAGYGKTAAELQRLLAHAQGFTIKNLAAAERVEFDEARTEAVRAIQSMLDGRKKYEAEKAEEAAASERAEMSLQEIQGIQQQVMIARTGRLGHVEGGTVEGVDKLIAETEAWEITTEKFGGLTASAEAVKQSAVSNLKQYRADLVREQDEKAAAERQAKAEADAKKARYPGDRAIVDALVMQFSVSGILARKWLAQYGKKAEAA